MLFACEDCHLIYPEITVMGKLEVTSCAIRFSYDREWLAKIKSEGKCEGEDEYSQVWH